MSQSIYYYKKETISLPGMIAICAEMAINENRLMETVALLYSPQSCSFAVFNEQNNLINAANKEITVEQIFEARIFNNRFEMRWLHEIDGTGRAVLLAEEALSLNWEFKQEDIVDKLPQQYLLWGKGVNSIDARWSQLATARIGKINVPIANVNDRAVQLISYEYLAEKNYGNVVVIDERLVGLEEYNG